MFYIDLKLMVYSREYDMICKAAEALELPEDSGLTVNKGERMEDIPQNDSAVIFDNHLDFLKNYKGKAKKAVLVEASEFAAFDKDVLELIDFAMIMPDGKRYDEKLLLFHLDRLVNEVKAASDKRRLEIATETAMDSTPDLIWFKNVEGLHLGVNKAFTEAVKKTKEDVYKKGHCYIWNVPESESHACSDSDNKVMENRGTLQFEEDVLMDNELRLITSYKSALIDDDGKVFGTCGVGQDSTSLKNMSKSFDTLTNSIPFGVLILDTNRIITNANESAKMLFATSGNVKGTSYDSWKRALSVRPVEGEDNQGLYYVSQTFGTRVIEVVKTPLLDVFGNNKGSIVIMHDRTLSYNYEQKEAKAANTDYLTNLNNRRSLAKYFKKNLVGKALTVYSFDLDNFKALNDRYGHYSADHALMAFSNELRTYFPNDFLVRIGGDEFLVVSQRPLNVDIIRTELSEFVSGISDKYEDYEPFGGLTISAGAAHYDVVSDANEFEDLLRKSDKAMYDAKHNGKDRFEIFEE